MSTRPSNATTGPVEVPADLFQKLLDWTPEGFYPKLEKDGSVSRGIIPRHKLLLVALEDMIKQRESSEPAGEDAFYYVYEDGADRFQSYVFSQLKNTPRLYLGLSRQVDVILNVVVFEISRTSQPRSYRIAFGMGTWDALKWNLSCTRVTTVDSIFDSK